MSGILKQLPHATQADIKSQISSTTSRLKDPLAILTEYSQLLEQKRAVKACLAVLRAAEQNSIIEDTNTLYLFFHICPIEVQRNTNWLV
jgi:hypothetical protein